MSSRSTAAAAEINKINLFYGLMPRLGTRWAQTRPWEGKTIAVNAHLTTLTGTLLRELALGGGKWVVSASAPATTDMGVVEWMREQGWTVYSGGGRADRPLASLDHEPDLIADVGFEMIHTLLEKRPDQVEKLIGAVELTRSGITRLRQVKDLPLPVININDGRLKPHVENRHGVGESIWMAVRLVTGLHLSGRTVLVIGYGAVGQGLAAYAKSAGATVSVVDKDAVRRLAAHYDGYQVPALSDGLEGAEIVVTATGHKGALTLKGLRKLKSDTVLVNAGHGGEEIAVSSLKGAAVEAMEIGEDCTRYRLTKKGPWLSVLGDGHPLNIVLNSGSPEPVLLHFALLGLTLEWLTQHRVEAGEIPVPEQVEIEAARLALQALGA